MQYKKFPPKPELSVYVECYYIWESGEAVCMDVESPPNACSAIAFNYGAPYFLSNQKYNKVAVPDAFVTGQSVQNYTLHLDGDVGIAGIALRPAGVYHFLKIPMYGLTDERLDLKEVDDAVFQHTLDAICQAVSHEAKVDILEHLIDQLSAQSTHGNKAVLKAANQIFEDFGATNITALLDDLPMSRRSFERKFLEEVGVSPKTYAKIRRFGYTCSLMAGNRDVNLMDVLHRGGYYDQSHFIKDFKYFSGRTPRKYAMTNNELANHVDRMAVVEALLHSNT